MAVETYTAVSWQPGELITEAKMDAIGSNLEYFNQNMPRAVYNAHGVSTRLAIKIAAGLTAVEPDPNGVIGKDTYFGDYFSAGCRPVVTTGIISDSTRRVHCTIWGINGTLFPDHNGFRAALRSDEIDPSKNAFTKLFYVSWIALGY